MSVVGIASTTGRLGVGAIADRIGTKRDAAMCCMLMAVAFILLITKVPALIWVAAAAFGVAFGGAAPLLPAIIAERIGTEQLATATGMCMTGAFAGAALGPFLGGLIFDVSGTYFWALLLSMGLSIVALIVALRMPPARRETLTR